MTETDPSTSFHSHGRSQRQTTLPAWLPRQAIGDQWQLVRERQAATRNARNRYLERLEEGHSKAPLDAWRDYQQAALEQRTAEGELLWGALGYAITDIAETAGAAEAATTTRGEHFVSWAIDADILETVTERIRIEIEVARRYPTLPESHVAYVASMLDLDRSDIERLREGDQPRVCSEG